MARKLQIGVIAQSSYIEVVKDRWGDGKDSWTSMRLSEKEKAAIRSALFAVGAEIGRRGHIVFFERDYRELTDAAALGAESTGGLAIGLCNRKQELVTCKDGAIRIMTDGIHGERTEYESRISVFTRSCDAIITVGYDNLEVFRTAERWDIPMVALLGVRYRDTTHDDLVLQRISSWNKSEWTHHADEAIEMALRLIDH